MAEKTLQRPTEQKKTFWQRVGDAFGFHPKDEFMEEYKRMHPDIPRKFKSPEKTTKPIALGMFKQIVKLVRDPEARLMVMSELDTLATDTAHTERAWYIQTRLGYTIYREVTGNPYCYPQYASLVRLKDLIASNFLDTIYKGIDVYKNASSEARAKFNGAVLTKEQLEALHQNYLLRDRAQSIVPEAFRDVNVDSGYQWISDEYSLKQFASVLRLISDPQKRVKITQQLRLMSKFSSPSYFENAQRRFSRRWFEMLTTKKPLDGDYSPMERDRQKRFLHFLEWGIRAYKTGTPELKEKFNEALLPDVKKRTVVAPNIVQQQNVR